MHDDPVKAAGTEEKSTAPFIQSTACRPAGWSLRLHPTWNL